MSASMYAQGVDKVPDYAALEAHESELALRFQARNEAVMLTMQQREKYREENASTDTPLLEAHSQSTLKPFVSTYAVVHQQEPHATNWTATFKDTLDYIFVRAGTGAGAEGSVKAQAATVDVLLAELLPRMEAHAVGEGAAGAGGGNQDGKRGKGAGAGSGGTIFNWQVESKPQPSEQWPSDHFVVRAELLLSL